MQVRSLLHILQIHHLTTLRKLRSNHISTSHKFSLRPREAFRYRARHCRCRYGLLCEKGMFFSETHSYFHAHTTLSLKSSLLQHYQWPDIRIPQTRADATKHYNGKVDFVKENLEKLQETISKKQDNLQFVLNIMHVKEQNVASQSSS